MAVLRFLYAKKLPLFLGCLAGAVLGLIMSFTVPDLYTAKVKVSPVSGGGMNAMLEQYGGLASLAGISLPQSDGGGRTELALATLDSDDFLTQFVQKHQFEVDLLAANKWSAESGRISYDPEYVDTQGRLINVYEDNYKLLREDFLTKLKDSMSVIQDKSTAFVTISFTHVSPTFSSELLRLLVNDVNNRLRDDDVSEATAAIEYLQKYVEEVRFTEVKEAMYGLIQSQIETVMLANIRPEYAFRIIDGPSVPFSRSSPNRLLYIVSGGVAGALAILITSSLISLRQRLRNS